jgi:GxxExxY protein
MSQNLNEMTEKIIRSAISVHRELSPGLLESAYEACLAYELAEKNLKIERQKSLPVTYRGMRLDCGYRIDLLVEDRVIVEIKAVESLEPNHEAQLLSHLKLSKYEVGLLINFNVKLLRYAIFCLEPPAFPFRCCRPGFSGVGEFAPATSRPGFTG